MKSTLSAAAVCLCIMPVAAIAGGSHYGDPHTQPAPSYNASATNNVAAMAQSHAVASAASRSASRSRATTGASTSNTGPSSASTGPVTVNNSTGGGFGGPSYSARGNTPDVILGSVSGGNPCGLGAGAGGSGAGAGGLLTFMWEGGGCQRLEDAKLLHNLGYESAAKERLCQDTRFATAFANSGHPCQADMARWQAAGYRQEMRSDGVVIWVR
jgi:hypothetical protein